MSCSCIPCPSLERTNSDPALERLDPRRDRWRHGVVERRWSGTIPYTPYEIITSGSSVTDFGPARKGHRKMHSSIGAMTCIEERASVMTAEPQLLRSSGRRRDWSFEDLKKSAVVLSM
ncbi:uncharacterized protein LOC143887025 [Tasmannia lanceolata]|uniref:uncharacterized protein LOC143887025 n=1 Tax=Tasmannia lanceolata TaxID=3420 RepID=UPI0040643F8B